MKQKTRKKKATRPVGNGSSRFDRLAPRRAAKPKNVALPGMEDRAIKPLEDVAAEYAEIRDHRMELTRDEVALKSRALKLMNKFGKTIYRHAGIEIRVVEGAPDVKVKIRKPAEDDDAVELTAEGADDAAADGNGGDAAPDDSAETTGAGGLL